MTKRNRVNRTHIIATALTETEFVLLNRLTEARNISMSELLRQLLWREYSQLTTTLVSHEAVNNLTSENLNLEA